MNSNEKIVVVEALIAFILSAVAIVLFGGSVVSTLKEGESSDTILSSSYSVEETSAPTVSIVESEEESHETTEEPESKETEAPEEIVPVYAYTEEELDLLARLIFSEGGIESYETQLKIGSVVMNRVDDPAFPDTIEEVIYQENQFSVTFIEMDGVVMIDRPADEEAKKAALEVLTYGSVLPPEVQVFYHKSITTGWVATREPYGTFDHTTFAYIYPKEEYK